MEKSPLETLFPSLQIFKAKYSFLFSNEKIIQTISYEDLRLNVEKLAFQLLQKKVKKGEKVLLIVSHSIEAILIDLALMLIGAISIPIDRSLPPKTIAEISEKSQARFGFIENINLLSESFPLKKMKELCLLKDPTAGQTQTKKISKWITPFKQLIPDLFHPIPLSPSEMEKLRKLVLEHISGLTTRSPEDNKEIVSLIYCSDAKGNECWMEITWQQILANIQALGQILPISFRDRILFFHSPWHLGYRHILLFGLERGASLQWNDSKNPFLTIRYTNPTLFISPLRYWQTLYHRLHKKIEKKSWLFQVYFKISARIRYHFRISLQFFTKEQTVFRRLNNQENIFQTVSILSKFFLLLPFYPLTFLSTKVIKEQLNSHFRYGLVIDQPIPENLDHFFFTMGITLLEAYIEKKSGAIIAMRRPTSWQHRPRRVLHTAGPLLHKADLRLIDPASQMDITHYTGSFGQIQLRGEQIPQACMGKNPDKEAFFTQDFWLKTTDLGRFTIHHELQLAPVENAKKSKMKNHIF